MNQNAQDISFTRVNVLARRDEGRRDFAVGRTVGRLLRFDLADGDLLGVNVPAAGRHQPALGGFAITLLNRVDLGNGLRAFDFDDVNNGSTAKLRVGGTSI